jgi:hypothetical protein
MARPNPRPAPVTSATCPVRSNIAVLVAFSVRGKNLRSI